MLHRGMAFVFAADIVPLISEQKCVLHTQKRGNGSKE